jgi:hypothetical protein
VSLEWSDLEEKGSEASLEVVNEFDECVLDVSNAITCLYNLLIAIANPTPQHRLENCSSIDIPHFHRHDIEHISNKYPKAPKFMIERLGMANLTRRQLLKYNEREHENIANNRRTPLEGIRLDELKLKGKSSRNIAPHKQSHCF